MRSSFRSEHSSGNVTKSREDKKVSFSRGNSGEKPNLLEDIDSENLNLDKFLLEDYKRPFSPDPTRLEKFEPLQVFALDKKLK